MNDLDLSATFPRIHRIARLVADAISDGRVDVARQLLRDDPNAAAVAVLALRFSPCATGTDNDTMLRVLGVPERSWTWVLGHDPA